MSPITLIILLFCFLSLTESQEPQISHRRDFNEEDVEINPFGNVIKHATAVNSEGGGLHNILANLRVPPPPTKAPSRISVHFENLYKNESIELYWLAPDGEEAFMTEIAPEESAPIETTVSHAFLGRGKLTGEVMNPRVLVIAQDTYTYTFQPSLRISHPPAPAPTIANILPIIPDKVAPKPYISILNRHSTSWSAKFRSLVPTPIDVWFEDGRGGSYQGTLKLGQEYTVNSYIGHVFFFTAQGNKDKVYVRHTVRSEQVVYVIQDPLQPAPPAMLEHLRKELLFMEQYKNRTGIPWIHYFGPEGPRSPPIYHMWEAKEIGQVHKVTSTEGHWKCLNYADRNKCKSSEPLNLELEVISLRPKAFIIKNLFSEVEADAIRAYAEPRMDASYVGDRDSGGARKSDTRTSRNTWLPRGSFPVTETLFHRAEQLLNISRLDSYNTEDLQVIHYINGQKYDSHHDWGVSGYPESRYITLLLYLNDMASIDAGGETSFPKGADGRGVKVHPGKGNALMFYNLLEDGNGDDISLHAALPVVKGEKWVANFWVWDPHRK
eukprot:gene9728-10568_t